MNKGAVGAGVSAFTQGAFDAVKVYLQNKQFLAQNANRERLTDARIQQMEQGNAREQDLFDMRKEEYQRGVDQQNEVKKLLGNAGGTFNDNFTQYGAAGGLFDGGEPKQQYTPDVSPEAMQQLMMQIGATTGDPSYAVKAAAMMPQERPDNWQDYGYGQKINTVTGDVRKVPVKPETKQGKSVYEMEKDIRGEFQKSAQDYYDARTAYDKIMSSEDTGVGDVSMIFAYMKTIDPTSTVREGEFATAEQTGGIPTRLVNLYNKALDGQRLTPDQRKNFRSQAEKLFDTTKKRYSEAYNIAMTNIENYGLNEDNIFGRNFSYSGEVGQQKPTATPGLEQLPAGSTDNGDGTFTLPDGTVVMWQED